MFDLELIFCGFDRNSFGQAFTRKPARLRDVLITRTPEYALDFAHSEACVTDVSLQRLQRLQRSPRVAPIPHDPPSSPMVASEAAAVKLSVGDNEYPESPAAWLAASTSK